MKQTANAINYRAKRILLPCFVVTELCSREDLGATRIVLPAGASDGPYYERPMLDQTMGGHHDSPGTHRGQYNFFPVILDGQGLPWSEAFLYILTRLEENIENDMSTYDGLGDDLAAYVRYLEEENVDWQRFSKTKLLRPTYRYSAHLVRKAESNEISASVAARRMSAVVALYRGLIQRKIFVPLWDPWIEKTLLINFEDRSGKMRAKEVTTTDLAIKNPRQDDPFDGTINDGEKLRPLTVTEQGWVLEALVSCKNIEMTLIYVFALLTGARIQTILTFRWLNIRTLTEAQMARDPNAGVRIRIGPGTAIDVKQDKRQTLHLPIWFYRMLLVYIESPRARRRRSKSIGSDNSFLFLSKSGKTFYSAKSTKRIFDPNNTLLRPRNGNDIRKFKSERLIPYIRARYRMDFHFRFHDLRASFCLNLTDEQLALVAQGKRTLSRARDYVRVRAGHGSSKTTDDYIGFRENSAHFTEANDEHGKHIREITETVRIQ